MPCFTIDSHNQLGLAETLDELPSGIDHFASYEELVSLTRTWLSARLVEIWNHLPGQQPVRRFTDRATALRRLWKAIQSSYSSVAPTEQNARTPERPRVSRKAKVRAPRESSKAAQVMALLRQPGGATLPSIMAATGWQAHSVRGFLSAYVGKKLGLKLRSVRREGVRLYSVR